MVCLQNRIVKILLQLTLVCRLIWAQVQNKAWSQKEKLRLDFIGSLVLLIPSFDYVHRTETLFRICKQMLQCYRIGLKPTDFVHTSVKTSQRYCFLFFHTSIHLWCPQSKMTSLQKSAQKCLCCIITKHFRLFDLFSFSYHRFCISFWNWLITWAYAPVFHWILFFPLKNRG